MIIKVYRCINIKKNRSLIINIFRRQYSMDNLIDIKNYSNRFITNRINHLLIYCDVNSYINKDIEQYLPNFAIKMNYNNMFFNKEDKEFLKTQDNNNNNLEFKIPFAYDFNKFTHKFKINNNSNIVLINNLNNNINNASNIINNDIFKLWFVFVIIYKIKNVYILTVENLYKSTFNFLLDINNNNNIYYKLIKIADIQSVFITPKDKNINVLLNSRYNKKNEIEEYVNNSYTQFNFKADAYIKFNKLNAYLKNFYIYLNKSKNFDINKFVYNNFDFSNIKLKKLVKLTTIIHVKDLVEQKYTINTSEDNLFEEINNSKNKYIIINDKKLIDNSNCLFIVEFIEIEYNVIQDYINALLKTRNTCNISLDNLNNYFDYKINYSEISNVLNNSNINYDRDIILTSDNSNKLPEIYFSLIVIYYRGLKFNNGNNLNLSMLNNPLTIVRINI